MSHKTKLILAVLSDYTTPNLFGVTVNFEDACEVDALTEAATTGLENLYIHPDSHTTGNHCPGIS